MRFRPLLICLLVAAYLLVGCSSTPPQQAPTQQAQNPFGKINHLIVLYQENWSFDSLYGNMPDAEGISNASSTSLHQIDKTDKLYTTLPNHLTRASPIRVFRPTCLYSPSTPPNMSHLN